MSSGHTALASATTSRLTAWSPATGLVPLPPTGPKAHRPPVHPLGPAAMRHGPSATLLVAWPWSPATATNACTTRAPRRSGAPSAPPSWPSEPTRVAGSPSRPNLDGSSPARRLSTASPRASFPGWTRSLLSPLFLPTGRPRPIQSILRPIGLPRSPLPLGASLRVGPDTTLCVSECGHTVSLLRVTALGSSL